MSGHHTSDSTHRGWRRVYGALSVLMPSAMRDKHGAAMSELFVRELERSAGSGRAAVIWTAAVGLGDLVQRGLYERVVEERTAMTAPNRQLLRQLSKGYVVAFVALTSVLLATYAWRQVERWSAHAISPTTLIELLVFAIPFTAALTLPMAMFIAVLSTASRSAATSDGAAARLRRAPLIGLASALALFAFAWNAEVVPRANARLAALQSNQPVAAPSDRTMTLGELRTAARRAAQRPVTAAGTTRLAEVASYGIEIHKKPAIAAACVVLALLALAISQRAPRAGVIVQLLASGVVFTVYYAIIMAGEALAERLVLSPMLAMWSANGVLLGIALLAMRRRRDSTDWRGVVSERI
ncbi:LptF/LptG family permease [Gemmatimonas groenlandica]|uniref:LptF/LptG family permease n=1 Tax=Gemmatimonas groenlandica TaxID=2732249 RepID=A0A6M4IK89_9BACT|nr:LptF/LptG family permease [Gemmatimonas groenlandica]QJR34278.1 LptF/LptG family permease [Gemmatimonas groenlandica]